MTAAVIVILTSPEGLPLTIAITTSFASSQLSKQKVLIKKPEALEIAGRLNEIVTSKTSTLTKGELKVKKLVIGDYSTVQPLSPKLSKEVLQLLTSCII